MSSFVNSKHTQQHQHRRKYKPMLCSLLKHDQVNQPLSPQRHSTSSSSSTSTSSDDPSSPRVGCMGQVKMNNYNFVSFLAPTSSCDNTSNITSNNNKNDHSNNYSNSISLAKYLNFRLKGFFSSRSFTSYPSSAIRAAVVGTHKTKTGRVRNIKINLNKESQMEHHNPRPRNSTGSRIVLCRCSIDNNRGKNEKGYCMVNLKEMDPPLPVLKRIPRQQYKEEERSSLWKRRSGGVPLKSIDVMIQQQEAQFSVPAETV